MARCATTRNDAMNIWEFDMDRHTLVQTRNQIDELLRHGSPSCIRQANSIMAENFEAILNFALELTEPKPKPKHTIADNYPAGGLTATEPCMYCEDYEVLQAENKQVKELLQAALPNIECKNNSQSGLISKIGEVLTGEFLTKS